MGNKCFVAGTQVVIGVEELPAEGRFEAIAVGLGGEARHLSAMFSIGIGLAGFIALQPIPQKSRRRRSRPRRAGQKYRNENDLALGLFDEEEPEGLEDLDDELPQDGNLVELADRMVSENIMHRGFVFEFTGQGTEPATALISRPDPESPIAVADVGAATRTSRLPMSAPRSQAPEIQDRESRFRKLPSPRWGWLAACLLVATWLGMGYSEDPNLGSNAVAPSIAASVPVSPRVRYVTKNIEDLEVGDKVLAWDEATRRQRLQSIDYTFRRVTDHLRILNIRSGDGTEQTIQTTNEHPFWVQGGGWIDAGRLVQGQRLLQSNGETATLIASKIELHAEGVPVFNLRVENSHTYFVAAKEAFPPILVHNANYKVVDMVPNKSFDVTSEMLKAEAASKFVQNGGDVAARTAKEARDLAQAASIGGHPPIFSPGHGPNPPHRPHYHPSGPNGGQLDGGGHVFY